MSAELNSSLTAAQAAWLRGVLAAKFRVTKWQEQPPLMDASFRAYRRIVHPQGSFMLMSYPPHLEDGERIVATSLLLQQNGVRVPRLYEYDLGLGAVLQEDFGEVLLADRNQTGFEATLYELALQQLYAVQDLAVAELQNFGSLGADKLVEEMKLFSDWFIRQWLECAAIVSPVILMEFYASLTKHLLQSPSCGTHLDFHSRNLCVLAADTEQPALGVIDYQDLRQGHFCYDIWSLLNDAYACLPPKLRGSLFAKFAKHASSKFEVSPRFVEWQFNLIGVQRCLKVCGIFVRLCLRDNKSDYLHYLPLMLNYLGQTLYRLQELQSTAELPVLRHLQFLADRLPLLLFETKAKLQQIRV